MGDVGGAPMPGLAVEEKAVTSLSDHAYVSLALPYEVLLTFRREVSTAVASWDDLGRSELEGNVVEVVQRRHHKARHRHPWVEQHAVRNRHNHRLVDVPTVDATGRSREHGVVRDDVAVAPEHGLGVVDYGLTIEHPFERQSAPEHLVPVELGRIAGGAGLLVRLGDPHPELLGLVPGEDTREHEVAISVEAKGTLGHLSGRRRPQLRSPSRSGRRVTTGRPSRPATSRRSTSRWNLT